MIVDNVAGVMKTATELTTLFRERGYRVTPQRQAIFRLLHDNASHPTVEALYERAALDMPTMSLKTVYQTVHDLEALGEVRILDLGTGSVRVDPNVEAEHHHLVCTECGRVRDVPTAIDHVKLPARLRREFTVDAVEVIFRGRCADCI
jgi:Fe2+ or Zn2+ uptake regulation protein